MNMLAHESLWLKDGENCATKKPLSGIFWVITDDLSLDDFSLLALDSTAPPTSYKGNSHTHKTAWSMRSVLFSGHPLYHSHLKRREFDYYPRGRVELRKRGDILTAIIWLNPDIHHPMVIHEIAEAFCLSDCKVQVKEDHSRHYHHKLPLEESYNI
ncbi:hypothetical protein LJB76_01555 [Clostridia bacterium OttesenSCG-928-O13]|nr:hypothetical protein [Clostridia bacterium OttesenSCG-928-O13]